ncbi:MAG: hypothetical protein M0Z49_02095 [Chloroflexi bacterium]|nr:hypothetical protein [Chloroflexota bacterium]
MDRLISSHRPRFRRGALVSSSALVLAVAGLASAVQPSVTTPTWPPATALLISEVQTGGASAADEFVELYNGLL